jgi:hypothetical protein
MPGDFEIVNVPVPVVANLVNRRHRTTIPNLTDPTHVTYPTYPAQLTYSTHWT